MMEPGGGGAFVWLRVGVPPPAVAVLLVAVAFAAVSLARSLCATRSPPAASFAVCALDSVASWSAAAAALTALAVAWFAGGGDVACAAAGVAEAAFPEVLGDGGEIAFAVGGAAAAIEAIDIIISLRVVGSFPSISTDSHEA
jgi:hypothetical protein